MFLKRKKIAHQDRIKISLQIEWEHFQHLKTALSAPNNNLIIFIIRVNPVTNFLEFKRWVGALSTGTATAPAS